MKYSFLLILLLCTTIIFAQSRNPFLIKDIGTYSNSSFPEQLITIGNITFFTANIDDAYGRELWKIDAITEEVMLLKDINPGTTSSLIEQLTVMNGVLYFVTKVNGVEQLWKSDGTIAGTIKIKEIEGIQKILVHQNHLYFGADDGVHGEELWKSDGTIAGTIMVRDLVSGSIGSSAKPILSDGGIVYFSIIPNGSLELWKTDGTAGGTVLVKNLGNTGFWRGYPNNFVKVNNTILFVNHSSSTGAELWKTDGTPGGTTLLKDINLGSTDSDIAQMTIVGNQLFFTASDNTNGEELWKSDGTSTGTALVKDIFTGRFTSSPNYLVAMNGVLYFSGNDGVHGHELWKSDGTSVGTVMLKDINTSSSVNSYPEHLTVWNNSIYFGALDTNGYVRLHKSDGTSVGTGAVSTVNFGDFFLNQARSRIKDMVVINNRLLFHADDGVHGYEWWYTDGSPANTRLIADLLAGSSSSTFHSSDRAAFGANQMISAIQTNTVGSELLLIDLSTLNTKFVDIYPGTIDGVQPSSGLHIFDQKIWFASIIPNRGLWSTDGTTSGTQPLVSGPGINFYYTFSDIKVADNSLYYINTGQEVWRTDAVTGNTVALNNRNNSYAESYLPYNRDTLYFHGNGQAFNQVLLLDIPNNRMSSLTNIVRAKEFIKANGKAYFVGGNTGNDRELWRIVGNTAILLKSPNTLNGTNGTVRLLGTLNSQLYFEVEDGALGRELWKTDGTVNGTVLVKDINPTGDANIGSFAVLNNILYFAADDGVNGQELWKTDGTANGTVLVKDINPNTGSYIGELMTVGNTLYFAADDGVHGLELWKSDGTTAGTVLVKDITTGTNWSNPTQLIRGGGDTLYFAAHDGMFNGIYQTDGNTANTKLLLALDHNQIGFSSVEELTYWKGKFYFIADDFYAGKEIFVYDPTVQILELKEVTSIEKFAKLYPNPNNGQFVIELDQMENMNLVILDMTGKLVHQEQVENKQTIEVAVTDLAQGVYFVRLYNDEKSQLLKFVKE